MESWRQKSGPAAVRLTNAVLRRDLFRFLVFGRDRVREGDDSLRERDVESGGFDRALQRFLDLPVGGPVISGGDPVSDSAHHCKDISHVDRTNGENDRKRQPIKEFRFYRKQDGKDQTADMHDRRPDQDHDADDISCRAAGVRMKTVF